VANATGASGSRPRPGPYRIVARAGHPEWEGGLRTRLVEVGDVVFGGPDPVVIAGPCAVENREQTLAVARAAKEAGARMLRGGAWKPRTSPYDFQGLGREGLEILAEARAATGLPIVTEVLDVRHVGEVAEFADMFQIGARSMQNYPLLREVGRTRKPALLKRHWAATLTEWLCAAEYIALEGNLDVVLCERGIRTFSQGEYNRNTLDLNVVCAARKLTYLPVVVDPSHGTGVSDLVVPASLAAVASGAHGLLVEIIGEDTRPEEALSDGYQAIRPSQLADLVARLPFVVPHLAEETPA
jgi:3-deoxy-7-phosphoheptulonate synthase